DSQFNLAQLYEHGSGVGLNGAEAYKWYLIAGRSGDAEARASALRLRERISPEARAVAERAAAAFRSTGGSTSGALAQSAASESASTAQRALSRLGYYQGPVDGVTSPALRMAIAAYQRDQGFEATGVLDQTTL